MLKIKFIGATTPGDTIVAGNSIEESVVAKAQSFVAEIIDLMRTPSDDTKGYEIQRLVDVDAKVEEFADDLSGSLDGTIYIVASNMFPRYIIKNAMDNFHADVIEASFVSVADVEEEARLILMNNVIYVDQEVTPGV